MTAAAGTVTEIPATEAWRAWVLLKAGYTLEDARLLAEHAEVDLHTAVYLVESGCPPDTALRILL